MKRLRTKWGVRQNGTLPNIVYYGLIVLLVGAGTVVATSSAVAEDDGKEARFKAESLRLRTALHLDPLLDDPLDKLVKLHVDARRSEELVLIYRTHLSKFPEDDGAKTVLAEILRRIDRHPNSPEGTTEVK